MKVKKPEYESEVKPSYPYLAWCENQNSVVIVGKYHAIILNNGDGFNNENARAEAYFKPYKKKVLKLYLNKNEVSPAKDKL